MTFPYKTVLMVGCTAGIGVALAERMIANGSYVIAVGRRKERLDAFVAKHGPDKAGAVQFDITNLDGIKSWVDSITTTYPSLDCVVLNSGIQRPVNFAKPTEVNLPLVYQEITTNYTSYVAMITFLLPHLQQKGPQNPAALIAVSSGLGLVPMPRCANYSATKAALHSLIWSIRAQLQHDKSSAHIKVIEIIPPAVQTELHMLQDDLRANGNTNFGMPLPDFIRDVWAGLLRGDDDIPVGHARMNAIAFESIRKEKFKDMVAATM
ncbi:short chain dehydrogenase [Camillea tinctor]|nr:short chain dehydrogenase [Camillea tinctor]